MGEFSVVVLKVIPFHAKFVELLGSILYLGGINKCSVEPDFEIVPEGFIIWIPPCLEESVDPYASVSDPILYLGSCDEVKAHEYLSIRLSEGNGIPVEVPPSNELVTKICCGCSIAVEFLWWITKECVSLWVGGQNRWYLD